MKKKNFCSHSKFNTVQLVRQKRGQIILEYILILIIVVAMATFMTTQLVGRGDGRQGIIISKWVELITMVANDPSD